MTALCTIQATDYVSLCKFASTEETRFYLNGVCVERQNNQVWLVATDGHCLGAIRALDGEAELSEAPVIVLSDKALLRLAKSKPAVRNTGRWISQYVDRVEVFDAVELSLDAESNSTRFPVATLPLKPIDGTFPDWRRVFPHDAPASPTLKNGTFAAFNADYYERFASPIDKTSFLTVQPRGESAAVVLNSDQRFIGLFMPARGAYDTHDITSAVNMAMHGAPLERPAESVAA